MLLLLCDYSTILGCGAFRSHITINGAILSISNEIITRHPTSQDNKKTIRTHIETKKRTQIDARCRRLGLTVSTNQKGGECTADVRDEKCIRNFSRKPEGTRIFGRIKPH
jgi:hypothetical protein